MFVQGLHDIFQNIKGKTYVLLWAKNNKVLTENWRALTPFTIAHFFNSNNSANVLDFSYFLITQLFKKQAWEAISSGIV